MKRINVLLLAALSVGLSNPTLARDSISISGSSTVYPFATVVGERFGRTTDFKAPKIESTGTGGGFKLFCAGLGEKTTDIANASRAIKASEQAQCEKNGVKDIIEVKFGYDGIALANANGAPAFSLSLKELYLALAKSVPNSNGQMIENPYTHWDQINPALPHSRIEVLGPPPTSGTRDAFVELAMEGGCRQFALLQGLKSKDKKKYKALCHGLREDGAFIEVGENDNLIVQKLAANSNALGIFGFSFLDQNSDKVQSVAIGGTKPTFETIGDGSYPISRPLFFYVKQAHLHAIPGLRDFVDAFTSKAAIGEEGYLTDRGLIPLEHAKWIQVRRQTLAILKQGGGAPLAAR